MSQQSIQFLSRDTETYGKQQPACTRPRLSNDLFKEAIHTFSPRRREETGPSTETRLWAFRLSRSPECSRDTAWTTKSRSCSLCSPPMLSRSSQFAKVPFFFFPLGEVIITWVFNQGVPKEKQKVISKKAKTAIRLFEVGISPKIPQHQRGPGTSFSTSETEKPSVFPRGENFPTPKQNGSA